MEASSASSRDPVDHLAEEFLERRRRGETPSLAEYVERCPELADEIRAVFPALLLMERADPDSKELGGQEQAPAAGMPRQLGDFRILREVGRGGMGIVYEAEQVSLGRRVALKVLPPQAQLDSRYLARFEREARAAARLHHTNIVPVYGVGTDRGVHYYAMQFIQGLGLDDVLAELRRLRDKEEAGVAPDPKANVSAHDVARSLLLGKPATGAPTVDHAPADAACGPELSSSGAGSGAPGQTSGRNPTNSERLTLSGRGNEASAEGRAAYWQSVARVGAQVAEALAYAHAEGVLHRDIKPSNLLLDARSHVWIADFGLAKAADSGDLTHSGDIVGTLRYMAPECFDGKADARSDVYALGLTLYELAALRPAFAESDRQRLIKQITTAEPAPLSRQQPRLPRDLATIIHKAIDREPTRRYQSADEIAADLHRFLEDRPIRARRTTLPERGWRWCRRNPAVATLVGVVILITLTGFAATFWQMQRALESEAESSRTAQRAADSERKAKASATDARKSAELAQQQTAEITDLNKNLKRLLHGANMNLARQSWNDGDISSVLGLLKSSLPKPGEEDLRGFEWFYLHRLCHTSQVRLPGDGEPQQLVFSSDGGRLLVVWEKGQRTKEGITKTTLLFQIWDTDPLREVASWELYSSRFHSANAFRRMAISPDGQRLAGLDDALRLNVWEIPRGKGQGTPKSVFASELPGGYTHHVAFSPDGKCLATLTGDTVVFWDAASGVKAGSFKGEQFGSRTIGFSPDARLVYGATMICSVPGGKPVRRVAPFVISMVGGQGRPSRWFLVFYEDNGKCTLWDAVGCKALWSWWENPTGYWIGLHTALSPDGQRLATSFASNWIKIWDVETGQLERTLMGHQRTVSRLRFNRDGKKLLSVDQGGSLRYWDPTQDSDCSDIHLAVNDAGHVMPNRLLSPSGRHAAFRFSDRLEMWDVQTGKKLFTLPRVLKPTFSPDGQVLAGFESPGDDATPYRHDVLRMWDCKTGRIEFTRRFAAPAAASPPIAVSPGGALVAVFRNAQPALLDTRTGAERGQFEDSFALTGQQEAAFSPDGKYLAIFFTKLKSVKNQRQCAIFDTATGKRVRLLELKLVKYLEHLAAMSSDGKLAVRWQPDAVRVWDIAADKVLYDIDEHGAKLTCWPLLRTGNVWQPVSETRRSSCGTPELVSRSSRYRIRLRRLRTSIRDLPSLLTAGD
jgi:serine/threonine protein kinase/WD40 repeat protein